jgi:ketosteroid isomerase-like protein
MSDKDLLDRIADFERAILDRDQDLAELCLHPAFALVLVHPSPVTMPRDRWMEMLPDYVVHSWDVEERASHVEGDCAAVLQRVDMRATVLGGDRSGTFVVTDVWRRGPDGWRLWRRHSTPLSAGPMPTA